MSDWFSINGCDIRSFPTAFGRYVDDSHARFETVYQSHSFLNILNKQNKAVRYTMEKVGQSRKLKFLDVTINKYWRREL